MIAIAYRSESYLVCFQNPFRIGNVQVSFSHGEGVVAGEVFHKLGRHSGLQHFGDAGVLERIEVIAVRHGEAGSHLLPHGEQVLGGVRPHPGLEIRGEDVSV